MTNFENTKMINNIDLDHLTTPSFMKVICLEQIVNSEGGFGGEPDEDNPLTNILNKLDEIDREYNNNEVETLKKSPEANSSHSNNSD